MSNSILFTLAAQGGNGYNVGTMKKSRGQVAAFVAALATALCVAFTGCETSSADDVEVRISPETATLTAANPSVTLTASGGWNYTWDVADGELGKLNKRSGSSVIYTAKTFGSEVAQTVTVTIGNFTNANATVSAEATIRQR